MSDMSRYRVSGGKLRAVMNEKPTDKQVEYVDAICELLGVNPPVEKTKKAYSEFIDEYSDEYKDTVFEMGLMYESSLDEIDARRDW